MHEPREGDDRDVTLAIPSAEADEMVVLAVAGDVDAFATLYRATVSLVFRNLYGRTGDRSLAEDLCSDVYMRALRSVRRFQGSSAEYLAWLMRIARNLFLDHVKSGRVRWETVVEQMPIVPLGVDAESEALASVEGAELRRALERLTADQQEVVYLRFLQGLAIADVARITGRAQGAVKALQFRALRTLARLLKERDSASESA